ncbi:cysteine--tRNA ligase [archaeon]|nr:cysteine--tRNA ligase [archaeon]
MSLEIYNTFSKKKEIFKPINENEVRMYVCGPTVNGVPHLGHARMQIVFDVFRKYLKFLNYKVKFVSNVTDIEDKIISKAKEEGISIEELTRKNLKEHMEDYKAIGILEPDVQPKATEYVPEMIDLIKRLEEKGYTYIIPEDGVYYNVSKFPDYGKLSGIDLTELRSSRELKDLTKGQEKRDSKDFVLWKFSKADEPSWDSPWGKGRPGWHIECSAMNHAILGLPIDIHAGGQDLIFPHHEDEIAQAEAGYGEKFCNYWMHNGMVNIEKVKMSKSLGNFTTIKDLLKEYPGEVIRYFIISVHYRKPVDFSKEKLDEAKISYERLKRLVLDLEDDKKINEKYLEEFKENMNEDLNTAGGLQILWKIVRDDKAEGRVNTIKEIDKVFSLNLFQRKEIELPIAVSELLDERKKVREEKNWALADELRDKIKELGFLVKDSKEGQEVLKL